MKASIGGVVNLFLLALFVIIIFSLIFFNLNYAKAFKVKNFIITKYEQYEGNCTSKSTICQREIEDYEKRIGYRITGRMVQNGTEECIQELGYCVIKDFAKGVDQSKETAYVYKIRTEIDVRFPLIDEIIGTGVFKVSGETKAIYVR